MKNKIIIKLIILISILSISPVFVAADLIGLPGHALGDISANYTPPESLFLDKAIIIVFVNDKNDYADIQANFTVINNGSEAYELILFYPVRSYLLYSDIEVYENGKHKKTIKDNVFDDGFSWDTEFEPYEEKNITLLFQQGFNKLRSPWNDPFYVDNSFPFFYKASITYFSYALYTARTWNHPVSEEVIEIHLKNPVGRDRRVKINNIEIDRELEKIKYLLDLDELSENDSRQLLTLLNRNDYSLKIKLAENASIKKNKNKTITVTDEKNSLTITHNKEKKSVVIEVDGGRTTHEYALKDENGTVNIYKIITSRWENFIPKKNQMLYVTWQKKEYDMDTLIEYIIYAVLSVIISFLYLSFLVLISLVLLYGISTKKKIGELLLILTCVLAILLIFPQEINKFYIANYPIYGELYGFEIYHLYPFISLSNLWLNGNYWDMNTIFSEIGVIMTIFLGIIVSAYIGSRFRRWYLSLIVFLILIFILLANFLVPSSFFTNFLLAVMLSQYLGFRRNKKYLIGTIVILFGWFIAMTLSGHGYLIIGEILFVLSVAYLIWITLNNLMSSKEMINKQSIILFSIMATVSVFFAFIILLTSIISDWFLVLIWLMPYLIGTLYILWVSLKELHKPINDEIKNL